jgi:hypothetical protein
MGSEKSPVLDGVILCSHWSDAAETSGFAGGRRCVSKI